VLLERLVVVPVAPVPEVLPRAVLVCPVLLSLTLDRTPLSTVSLDETRPPGPQPAATITIVASKIIVNLRII